MIQQLISTDASEIERISRKELSQSIEVDRERVILSENMMVHPSVTGDITCAEMSKVYGADMILLNVSDVNQSIVVAVYEEQYTTETYAPNDGVAHRLRELIGSPIDMNVEPVDESLDLASTRVLTEPGRKVPAATLEKVNKSGLDSILLTSSPGTGVANDLIAKSVTLAKKRSDGIIIAGKMHSSGIDEPVASLKSAEQFTEVGADIALVPTVGTIWSIDDQQAREAVDFAHSKGKLVMSAIGTPQESAQPEAIRATGIRNKILGVDIQHIGDANMGLVDIENIKELPDVIRGKRHTAAGMVRSINR